MVPVCYRSCAVLNSAVLLCETVVFLPQCFASCGGGFAAAFLLTIFLQVMQNAACVLWGLLFAVSHLLLVV